MLAICQRELPRSRTAIHAADVLGSAGAAAAGPGLLTPAPAAGSGGAAARSAPLERQASTGAGGVPELQLNCLVAIVDPPRDEAIAAVRTCLAAGITVKVRGFMMGREARRHHGGD